MFIKDHQALLCLKMSRGLRKSKVWQDIKIYNKITYYKKIIKEKFLITNNNILRYWLNTF